MHKNAGGEVFLLRAGNAVVIAGGEVKKGLKSANRLALIAYEHEYRDLVN